MGKMTLGWWCWLWKLAGASLLGMGGAIAYAGDCALAQIVPDDTLGAESSVVTPTNNNGVPTEQIDGGAVRGANLFHSFDEFSIPTGGAAYFNNAPDIQNIISRVTGGKVSNIDGLISARGTANLFLLNPNGIIFGSNASLNIGGSFLGSTASSLNFADGTQFSATTLQTTPLLTVSVPLGLQYGGTAGGIQVQKSILQVQNGQTLALMGGDVSVEGGEFGFLSALGGRIELGGLADAGMVDIEGQQSEGAFRLASLRFPDWIERADVLLTNLAYFNVAAVGNGSIAITARNIDISGGSVLRGGLETNLGVPGATAGDITLNATRAINVANSSGIANNVRTGAVGKGGDINITTGSLSVTNGAKLSAYTFGQGDAGSVNINARDTVYFGGNDSIGNVSGVFSDVYETGEGLSGDIRVTTGSLTVTNGATLSASTYGKGDAGSVIINARDTVSFDGVSSNERFFSGAYSNVQSDAIGQGGIIRITTGSLSVNNAAELDVGTFGRGDAGSVIIDANDTVSFDGGNVFNNVEKEAIGQGGDIRISTGSLSITNGGELVTTTFGQGAAGDVIINARDTISFDGVDSNGFSSGVFSDLRETGRGQGGEIRISTGSLSLTNGAQLAVSTSGQGDAGSVTINARDTVSFDGVGINGGSSGVFSSAESGSVGNGSNINITAESLSVTNGGRLTASSEGIGAAGNIEVAADSIRLDNKAFLSSNTTAGQGNIFLDSEDLVLRRESNITTDATGTATGGNITINTGVIAASENSDITANAEEASGGRVIIDAQGIFGTEFRERENPATNDITASSNLGFEFSGTVEINTPDVDPSQGLVTLPTELVDASRLIASGCGAGGRQGESEFIVTGRGGLPIRPIDANLEPYPTGSVRSIPSTDQENSSTLVEPSTNPITTAPTQIVEASGWLINNKGEVVLIARTPTVTPHIPSMRSLVCHTL